MRQLLRDSFRNPLFLSALLLKIICSFLFASDYLAGLFAPFVNGAITTDNFFSVYDEFLIVKPDAFPYPPVMLYLLVVSRLLMAIFFPVGTTIGPVDLFAARLPLLASDLLLLLILCKWTKNFRSIIWWYWLNPIVFYVCYIHGQLDLIPTALLCMSLFYLFRRRNWFFILFYALAIATKFHIIATLPLIIIYLYKDRQLNLSFGLKYGAGLLALVLAMNFPFVLHEGFLQMVYKNKEQAKVFDAGFTLLEKYRILLIPAGYVALLYAMWDFRIVNKEILLIFMALSYGIITFFIVPNQGWHIWNIPFFVYCITRFNFQSKMLFAILNLSYFLFFTVSPKSDFPQVAQFIEPGFKNAPNLFMLMEQSGINGQLVNNLSYTLLQITLFLFCLTLFSQGVSKIRRHKIYFTPYLIGIGGDSGSGKSTLSSSIEKLFGVCNTLVVHGDDMHRWERGHEKWKELTHLDPRANWLHQDISDLMDLKQGRRIFRRSYEHSKGKFTEPLSVKPERLIIYEGLHPFYLVNSGRIYDLKIFMKPSEDLRRRWKVERDVHHRGYATEKVLEDIERRMPDSIHHILNQEKDADMVFSVIESHPADGPEGSENFSMKIVSSNDIFFEKLLDTLRDVASLHIRHDIDRHCQQIFISGAIHSRQVKKTAETLSLNLDEIIGTSPDWEGNNTGIMQLFVLFYFYTQFKRGDSAQLNQT
ncbi:MAG TPA: hypothetical protein VNJ07_07605 [Chitinophagales bacterium]|nr:hypothetical protein [Chitinophagales bacterium]